MPALPIMPPALGLNSFIIIVIIISNNSEPFHPNLDE
jgi:hypothetical protein